MKECSGDVHCIRTQQKHACPASFGSGNKSTCSLLPIPPPDRETRPASFYGDLLLTTSPCVTCLVQCLSAHCALPLPAVVIGHVLCLYIKYGLCNGEGTVVLVCDGLGGLEIFNDVISYLKCFQFVRLDVTLNVFNLYFLVQGLCLL